MLPFPSSYFSRSDPTTVTGIRIDLTDAALPVNVFGTVLEAAPYNQRDGFSTVATLLAQFPERIDARELPGPAEERRSVSPDSPIQLLEYPTGERVPLFAELDANAGRRLADRPLLIIQPLIRLKPKTRYIAVIQHLRSDTGTDIVPPRGFLERRDAAVPPKPFTTIFTFLQQHGFRRASLQLAWDFTTGSDESVVGRLLSMRDQALNRSNRWLASEGPPPITLDSVEKAPHAPEGLLLRMTGHFKALSFLNETGGLHAGPDGEPTPAGEGSFPISIHVPACATTATRPLPVLIYGHGTYNTAANEMSNDYSRELLNRLCMIEVGTDWLGRSRSDLVHFLFRVLPDWNHFPRITERLQQAHVNVLALARLIRSGVLQTLSPLSGIPVDTNRIYYYGISEGGCQGTTALALSPDIEKGALNVPCGFWTMFFSRSSDFHQVLKILRLTYPDAADRQKLFALSQLLWDYTDPANYGAHLLRDPLPGSTLKQVLFQEGINDASVPNLTTRAMARTIGLPLLAPAVEPVFGIDAKDGPLDSAYVQYDVGIGPRLGGTNVPPPVNPVHERVRRLEAVNRQLAGFFGPDGKVVDSCDGRPCRFP